MMPYLLDGVIFKTNDIIFIYPCLMLIVLWIAFGLGLFKRRLEGISNKRQRKKESQARSEQISKNRIKENPIRQRNGRPGSDLASQTAYQLKNKEQRKKMAILLEDLAKIDFGKSESTLKDILRQRYPKISDQYLEDLRIKLEKYMQLTKKSSKMKNREKAVSQKLGSKHFGNEEPDSIEEELDPKENKGNNVVAPNEETDPEEPELPFDKFVLPNFNRIEKLSKAKKKTTKRIASQQFPNGNKLSRKQLHNLVKYVDLSNPDLAMNELAKRFPNTSQQQLNDLVNQLMKYYKFQKSKEKRRRIENDRKAALDEINMGNEATNEGIESQEMPKRRNYQLFDPSNKDTAEQGETDAELQSEEEYDSADEHEDDDKYDGFDPMNHLKSPQKTRAIGKNRRFKGVGQSSSEDTNERNKKLQNLDKELKKTQRKLYIAKQRQQKASHPEYSGISHVPSHDEKVAQQELDRITKMNEELKEVEAKFDEMQKKLGDLDQWHSEHTKRNDIPLRQNEALDYELQQKEYELKQMEVDIEKETLRIEQYLEILREVTRERNSRNE
eukprot:NODE_234_length_12000_cov_0.516343.p1 type:complete len:556 gc:universal NODE_234_length_12000_cov_0.516343:7996-6329(-)